MLPLRLALVAVLLGGQFIVPRPPATPAVFAGSDTFSSALNATNWTVIDREGDQSNAETQCYKPANQSIVGGFLRLTMQTQSVTCNTHAYSWTSSMVQWKTYNFRYGTVEFAGTFAGGAGSTGTWPAVWMLGVNCQDSNPITADDSGDCVWPTAGSDEIDIAEYSSSARTDVNQQIHSGANNGGCNPSLTDASANSHVYQLIWQAGDLVWKIDGVQTCHVTVGVPSSFMFLIINVATRTTPTGLPQSTNIDYVTITP